MKHEVAIVVIIKKVGYGHREYEEITMSKVEEMITDWTTVTKEELAKLSTWCYMQNSNPDTLEKDVNGDTYRRTYHVVTKFDLNDKTTIETILKEASAEIEKEQKARREAEDKRRREAEKRAEQAQERAKKRIVERAQKEYDAAIKAIEKLKIPESEKQELISKIEKPKER